MSKQACHCKEPEECEECPEWIFTLADLIMCMMGLFVILWVLKPGGGGAGSSAAAAAPALEQDLTKVIAAVREAFGTAPDLDNPTAIDLQMVLRKLERLKSEGPGEGGRTKLKPKGADGSEPEVTTIRPGQQAAVGGRLPFAPGDATLAAAVKPAVDQIAQQIRGHRNIVLVKGHTALDDFPDSATPQQRMGLSLRRAQVVADYLTSAGVEPDILRVQGCSTFEPVAQRAYSDDARSLNRRVEVEATAALVGDYQDRTANGPVGTESQPKVTGGQAHGVQGHGGH